MHTTYVPSGASSTVGCVHHVAAGCWHAAVECAQRCCKMLVGGRAAEILFTAQRAAAAVVRARPNVSHCVFMFEAGARCRNAVNVLGPAAC
jgi:hypothetical protein